MPVEPRPLAQGTLLADRFEVEATLGRGAFGIVYRVRDRQRGDLAVVKELAPAGVPRIDGDMIRLPEESAHRLRQNFLNEAGIISRLRTPGILPVRVGFVENGTAYFATDYLPNAKTVETVLAEGGRMDPTEALDILYQCLDTLENVHSRGILHRDIKPSNILLNSRGEATLIDFGAAREWQADATSTHTVLFTPSYAPLEQMAERARRGPATDLYSLAATYYEMVSGSKPPSATDRATGAALPSLCELRPGIEPSVAEAIEACLALKYSDRPQSVQELRRLLARDSESDGPTDLLELDAAMVRLQKFSFERRQCPACHGVLEESRPLRRGTCPVCQEGQIKLRNLHRGTCPFCKVSPLRRAHNAGPVRTCPACSRGWLELGRKGLLGRAATATCPACHETITLDRLGEDARIRSGRSEWVWRCGGCGSQLDEMPDGRLEDRVGQSGAKHKRLYPEEWDCVAAGLEPGAGNAECTICGADYYVEGDTATLLTANDDPYEFASANLGRLLTWEEIRWIAVGKSSPEPGLVCQNCRLEFDRDCEYFRLVRTTHRILARHIGEPNTLLDWHRMAQGLPCVAEEAAFQESLHTQIAESYRRGEIGFDDANTVAWKGPASSGKASGQFVLTPSELTFGGVLKKRRWPTDAILSAEFADGVVWLQFRGESEPIEFNVVPVELTVSLKSGRYAIDLTGEDLSARIDASTP